MRVKGVENLVLTEQRKENMGLSYTSDFVAVVCISGHT